MKLLNYINPKYKNKDIKLLISNFFNLAIVQGLDLILPLLTIPYTTRVLGFQKLGIIAFAVALVGYFGIIINYGFICSFCTVFWHPVVHHHRGFYH